MTIIPSTYCPHGVEVGRDLLCGYCLEVAINKHDEKLRAAWAPIFASLQRQYLSEEVRGAMLEMQGLLSVGEERQ